MMTPRFRGRSQRPPGPELESAMLEAAQVISTLADFWADATGHDHFMDQIFGPMWDEGPAGAEHEKAIENWDSQPDEAKPLGILQAAFVSCGYAIDAMKAEKAGERVAAWQMLMKAKYWLGCTIGAWGVRNTARAIADGRKRGTKNRAATYLAARQWAWDKWQNERAAYKENRSAAARDYERLIPQNFSRASGEPLKVSKEILADKWLKSAPPPL